MTTLTKTDEISIIKTDEVGRRQTPAVRRERLLDEFDRSGLSAARFAAVTGLKYSTFAAWVHCRRGTTSRLRPASLLSLPPSALVGGGGGDDANGPVEPISAVVVLQLPGGVVGWK